MHGQVARRISVGSVATSRLWLPLRIQTFELRATPGVSVAFETVDLTLGRRRLEFRTLRLEIRGGSGCPVLITRLINNAATSNGGVRLIIISGGNNERRYNVRQNFTVAAGALPATKTPSARTFRWFLPSSLQVTRARREFPMKLCRAVSRCTVDFAYTAENFRSIERRVRPL